MTPATERHAELLAWPDGRIVLEQVGGKACQLHELAALGLPVPRWFVLTTAATDAILAPVRPEIARLADGGDEADLRTRLNGIAATIRTAPWPRALVEALGTAVCELDSDTRLAVRSSVVGEDGAAHSHAGVFLTRLGVPAPSVAGAVRECLTSAFSERVARYREARALRGAWPPVALVIQEMVDARVAGVAFTADPATGAPRLIVVSGYGLGVGVVDDVVETDSFERIPGSAEWSCTVRRKKHRVIADGAGGTVIAGVARADQARPSLTPEDLNRLGDLLLTIERVRGAPQDVEWAVDAAGRLHVLQARPITTAAGALTVWDDSNIGESYPGITLPLTYSLVRRTYARLFRKALADVGVPPATLARLHDDLEYLIGTVDGHLYMNLLAYYRLFAAAPGIGWTVPKWEKALGIGEVPEMNPRRRAAGESRLARALLAVRVWWRLARRFHGIDDEVGRFRKGVEEMATAVGKADLWHQPFDRLLEAFASLEETYLDDWTVLIFNDLFAFVCSDRLARLCGSAPGSGGSDLHQRLLADLGRVASTQPLEDLRTLATTAREVPAVERLVWSDLPPQDVWERLGADGEAESFRAEVAIYMSRYGDRTVEELKLETETPADQPWVIVDLLRSEPRPGAPLRDSVPLRGLRGAAEREYRARVHGRPLRWWYASWLLRRTRTLIAAREQMSLARARAYGLLRRLARAMGAALVREGALSDPGDVHFATLEDLEAYARGGLPGLRLDGLVAARAEAYRRLDGSNLPRRLICRGSVYRVTTSRSAVPASPSTNVLAGVPCSPGIARGVACVVEGAVCAESVRDKILVARVTEPGWIFVLSLARGVVVERGSLLSHAAIIGRELGVPTVVGVTGAMSAMRSGDEVELNGSTGEVRILRRGESCSA
jgi:pyruvate,water dikinase